MQMGARRLPASDSGQFIPAWNDAHRNRYPTEMHPITSEEGQTIHAEMAVWS